MDFRVETTPEAESDVLSILDWLIEEDAGQADLRWFQRLEDALISLRHMPERCPIAPESESVAFPVRALLYERRPHLYRILFTIEDEVVYVLPVWHSRRRPTAG